jgi:hypothetical protein
MEDDGFVLDMGMMRTLQKFMTSNTQRHKTSGRNAESNGLESEQAVQTGWHTYC